MRFAFSADWHLSRYGQDKLEDTSLLPERLSSIKSSLKHMAEYCTSNSIGNMVVGGDLLHGKSIIYTIAQNIMLEYFHTYPNIMFYVIDGNHDLSGKGPNVESSLKSIDMLGNVHRVTDSVYKKENMTFVPYSSDMIKHIKENSSDMLISHFGLNEGVLNSGLSIVADIGLKDIINKYKLALLGHYHKPQHIDLPNFQLYYSGSLIQLDWGEKHEDKRFLVVDSETLKVESIPTHGYKKYYVIELTPENRGEVISEARKLAGDGHHVTINKVEEMDTEDLDSEFRVIDKTEKDITSRGITVSMSHRERLEKYCVIKEVPESARNYVIDVGIGILDRCTEVEEESNEAY